MTSTDDFDKAASDIRRPGTAQADGVLDTRELIRHATLAASSHNTQPWKFRIQQDSITILPDFSRRCPAVDPDDSHLFKSLGCAAENLVHAAAAQGFSAEVRFDPGEDGVIVLLNRDASNHATDLYRAITKRQCVKAAYDGTPLEAPDLKMLEKAGEGWNVRAIMLLSAAQKGAVIDYVTRGNIAQLTDRAFRDEDDFGLKPLRPPEDETFHDLVAERYERAATILTSNLDFGVCRRRRPRGPPRSLSLDRPRRIRDRQQGEQAPDPQGAAAG